MVDGNELFPDECGQIQIKTLTTSDPCGCKDIDGSDFETKIPIKQCNLCGGNKIIGDPDRVIDTGILEGATCIDVFDDNRFGTFVSVCSTAQDLVQKFCKCVNNGTAVNVCIPLEDRYCDRNDKSDVCCSGSCKYLKSKKLPRLAQQFGDDELRSSLSYKFQGCIQCSTYFLEFIFIDPCAGRFISSFYPREKSKNSFDCKKKQCE